MAQTPSPSGTYQTPDQDESAQLDVHLAALAAQVEKNTVSNTKGTRSRVHVAKNIGGTTDASGYLTVNHGAPFTPSVIQPSICKSGTTLAVPISVDNITATQVTVRFTQWTAVGAANVVPLNSSLALVCWE